MTSGDRNEVIISCVGAHFASGLEIIANRYPATYEKLVQAARRLTDGDSSDAYQEVGMHCRDAMIRFADSIYSPDFLPNGKDAAGDQNKIEYTLAHFGQLAGTQRERDLAKKAQAYAMGTHHDLASDEAAARRALTATTLALVELAHIMETATANNGLMARWGRYKCGGCGSTRVNQYQEGDYEGPGPWILQCEVCNWLEME